MSNIKDKTSAMKQIRDELVDFKESPLYEYRVENNYFPVIGEGDHNADILFIGEAPGENEAKRARPFCGASGRILDELLHSIELDRDTVYVTNVVKDRPPSNRDPSVEEIKLYTPFLIRQIDIIEPRIVATLGRFAMDFMLENFDSKTQDAIGKLKISEAHGKSYDLITDEGTEFKLIPLYHPAVALYNGSQKDVLLKDFQILKNIISA